jgi:starch-binding outer membrane protein, SusD/RagB family
MEMHVSRFCLLALLPAFIFSCQFDLNVPNLNEPDRERVLTSPEELEAYVGGAFWHYWYGTHYYAPSLPLSVIADEGTSSWGNWECYHLSSEPRQASNNSITLSIDNQYVNLLPWHYLYRAISITTDGLKVINNGMCIVTDEEGDNSVRLRAYAKFVMGICYGFLGCFFDRGYILDETIDLETIRLKLQNYMEVVKAGISQLRECIAICETTTFTLPAGWIKGNALSQDELKVLAHSYIARFMASVGRTVEERNAADWPAIKVHADQGINSDFLIYCDGDQWWSGLHYLGAWEAFLRSDMRHVGTADTSGNFEAWMNSSLEDRREFFVYTPDQRFTSGDSCGVGMFDHVGTDYWYKYPIPFRPDLGTYHFSYYYHGRYYDHLATMAASPVPEIKVTELDMLRAEYYLRIGDAASAAAEINKTRTTRGGLEPVSAADGIGSVSDKPRIFGSLWSTMKYEKNIECDHTGVGLAWMDDRGWGDLVKNTLIHFPIPARELEILMMDNYTFGGGGPGSAPKRMIMKDILF